jgi:hypothetical protein
MTIGLVQQRVNEESRRQARKDLAKNKSIKTNIR